MQWSESYSLYFPLYTAGVERQENVVMWYSSYKCEGSKILLREGTGL